jgi:hypothetical protein
LHVRILGTTVSPRWQRRGWRTRTHIVLFKAEEALIEQALSSIGTLARKLPWAMRDVRDERQ